MRIEFLSLVGQSSQYRNTAYTASQGPFHHGDKRAHELVSAAASLGLGHLQPALSPKSLSLWKECLRFCFTKSFHSGEDIFNNTDHIDVADLSVYRGVEPGHPRARK